MASTLASCHLSLWPTSDFDKGIFSYGLQLRILLKITTYLIVCLVRALLEMRVLFEGGPYMRK